MKEYDLLLDAMRENIMMKYPRYTFPLGVNPEFLTIMLTNNIRSSLYVYKYGF